MLDFMYTSPLVYVFEDPSEDLRIFELNSRHYRRVARASTSPRGIAFGEFMLSVERQLFSIGGNTILCSSLLDMINHDRGSHLSLLVFVSMLDSWRMERMGRIEIRPYLCPRQHLDFMHRRGWCDFSLVLPDYSTHSLVSVYTAATQSGFPVSPILRHRVVSERPLFAVDPVPCCFSEVARTEEIPGPQVEYSSAAPVPRSPLQVSCPDLISEISGSDREVPELPSVASVSSGDYARVTSVENVSFSVGSLDSLVLPSEVSLPLSGFFPIDTFEVGEEAMDLSQVRAVPELPPAVTEPSPSTSSYERRYGRVWADWLSISRDESSINRVQAVRRLLPPPYYTDLEGVEAVEPPWPRQS